MAVSTVLQFAAAFLALRLVAITKHRVAWILVASAIFLMAIRRSIPLFRIVTGRMDVPTDNLGEIVALLISILMFVGVALIGTVFREIQRSAEERRAFDAQIQHAQKLESLGVLAGGIAHDFNNLLAVILGNVDLVLANQELPENARDNLENALTATDSAAALCGQLLAYSGRGQISVEPVDVSEMVRDIAKLMEISVSKMATLECELESDLPLIKADKAQLQQVVMNLIINASEAIGPTPGRILVSARRCHLNSTQTLLAAVADEFKPGEYVELAVSDDGPGMGKEARARLFEPFYTTKFAGRGLGLAAVQGIVRGHGGAIALETEDSRGTTFRVYLPAPNPPLRRATTTSEAVQAHPRGQGSILVVDDETMVRDVARQILEVAGFRVQTATNGREALDLCRAASAGIAVVVLDLTMPELDGEQTLRELKRLDPGIPVVLMSGYDAGATARQSFGHLLAGFVQKPFSAGQLVGAVESALR